MNFAFCQVFFNFQNQHHTFESVLQFGVWLPIKSEQLLFLFPQKYGKLAWIHLKLRLVHYCNPVVNGDPQKAAQMICAADGSVHRMEEQEMLTPIEHTVHDILCVGVNYTDHLEETKEHLAGAVSDEVSDTVRTGY